VAAVQEMARPYRPTALPSVAARILAFVAILVGGVCGGLIGYAFLDLQCGPDHASTAKAHVVREHDSGCDAWSGVGGVAGAVVGAGGTGVVAVLVLRAMSEWRRDLDVDDPPDVDSF
jgi:hypothetical protein